MKSNRVVQFRMKFSKDTRKECDRRDQTWNQYFSGKAPPHFPVPSVLGTLSWVHVLSEGVIFFYTNQTDTFENPSKL